MLRISKGVKGVSSRESRRSDTLPSDKWNKYPALLLALRRNSG